MLIIQEFMKVFCHISDLELAGVMPTKYKKINTFLLFLLNFVL